MEELKSRSVPTELKGQKKRIWSLDFAKGFALIFVVVIHILDQLSTTEVRESAFAYVIYMTGRLVGAVVFMFLMGVAMSFSSRSNLKAGIKRGFEVMVVGYILNFFRGTLPVWIGLYNGKYTFAEIEPYTPTYLLMEFDILPFAGFALIILTLIKNYFRKPWFWPLVGCLVLVITPLAHGLITGIAFIDLFLHPLWGTAKYVHFPVFPWLAYPLFGMFYGHYLLKAKNRVKFIWQSVLLGIVLVLAFSPVLFINPDFQNYSTWHKKLFYFRNSSLGAIWYTGFVCIWMALCYFLVEKIPVNTIFNRLYYWSKQVTNFYCVQWILIGWISANIDRLPMGKTIGLMIVMIILTDRITVLWNRGTFSFKRQKNETAQLSKS